MEIRIVQATVVWKWCVLDPLVVIQEKVIDAAAVREESKCKNAN
jgi:hypothetical protein